MTTPSADELAAIRSRDAATTWNSVPDGFQAARDRRELLAWADHLQALNVSFAERIAAQSELLSKKAEKAPTIIPDDQLPTLTSMRGMLKPPTKEPDPLAEDLKAVAAFEAAENAYKESWTSQDGFNLSVARAVLNKRACERFPALVRELQAARAALGACWEISGDGRLVSEIAAKALGWPEDGPKPPGEAPYPLLAKLTAQANLEGAKEAWANAVALLRGLPQTALPTDCLADYLDLASAKHLAELGAPETQNGEPLERRSKSAGERFCRRF